MSVRAQRVPLGLFTPRARADTSSVSVWGVIVSVVFSPVPGPSTVSRFEDWAVADGAANRAVQQPTSKRGSRRLSIAMEEQLGVRTRNFRRANGEKVAPFTGSFCVR
jgi:hypothetical protein